MIQNLNTSPFFDSFNTLRIYMYSSHIPSYNMQGFKLRQNVPISCDVFRPEYDFTHLHLLFTMRRWIIQLSPDPTSTFRKVLPTVSSKVTKIAPQAMTLPKLWSEFQTTQLIIIAFPAASVLKGHVNNIKKDELLHTSLTIRGL